MGYAPRRKRCPQCRLLKTFKKPKQGTCSVKCEVARRRAAGFYGRLNRASRAKLITVGESRAIRDLKAAGASDAVIAVALRIRDNVQSSAWQAGRAVGWKAACEQLGHKLPQMHERIG